MEQPKMPRDISWLKFNHRVLQEAQDKTVPLYERIKFLAIFSSNLDEFFRVRVSSLRSFKQLRKKTREKLNLKPKKILKEIQRIVEDQQQLFGHVYRNEIIPALNQEGIFLLQELEYLEEHEAFARNYFEEKIAPLLAPLYVKPGGTPPLLRNNFLYLVLDWEEEHSDLALLELPVEELGRFIILPSKDDHYFVTFLDDLIRFNLPYYFKDRTFKTAYAIKLSRDAEIYIDDEFSGNLLEKIKQGLFDRNVGTPTRLLYDAQMPEIILEKVIELLALTSNDLVEGARYHNFNDFFGFPDPKEQPNLHDKPLPPLAHPQLEQAERLFDLIWKEDQIIHFPYQKYDYVTRLLREAIEHPQVTQIKITLYRVASKSAITQTLLEGIQKGKRVVVFIEAKARFDEASNLYWGQRLSEAGAKVIYSYPGIKVHTKLLLIQFKEDATPDIAYIGTGNFNEKTAKLYCDHALLTADKRLTPEVAQVFELLEGRLILPQTEHLLISPYTLRDQFIHLIQQEIKLAQAGKDAYIIIKMNSLEDPLMIDKLYEASQAGVRIQLIVRGICCLLPGVEGLSENIEAISIVDRFLEHARIYVFGNGGNEKMYIASADWMTRNLDRRVEVAAPIFDPSIYKELRKSLELQLLDNRKARILDPEQRNLYQQTPFETAPLRSQVAFYQYLKKL